MKETRQLGNIWEVNPRRPPNSVKIARILQQRRQKSTLKKITSIVAKASQNKVDRAIAAARELIRQQTTHLTEDGKVEVQNNIHGGKRAKEIALGDAVMHSIREFHTWCNKDPVLSNESRLQAQRIVGMATLPISDGGFDRLYSQKT